jgi:hypothetical protein
MYQFELCRVLREGIFEKVTRFRSGIFKSGAGLVEK